MLNYSKTVRLQLINTQGGLAMNEKISGTENMTPEKESGSWKIVLWLIIFVILAAMGGFIYFQHEILQKKISQITTLETEKKASLDEQDKLKGNLEDITNTINEVAAKLQDVRKKQGVITDLVARAQVESSQKGQILNDIAVLEEQLARDKRDVETLNSKVRQSGIRIKSLETMVANLKKELDKNVQRVADLKSIIEDKNAVITQTENSLKNTQSTLANVRNELSQTSEDLEETKGVLQETKNTAYFVVGTKDELKAKNIVDEEGRFFQKKSLNLSAEFDEGTFTRIDITKEKEFPITSSIKDVKVIPQRSESSFQLIETGQNQTILKVVDPDKFWKIRYMAVVIKS